METRVRFSRRAIYIYSVSTCLLGIFFAVQAQFSQIDPVEYEWSVIGSENGAGIQSAVSSSSSDIFINAPVPSEIIFGGRCAPWRLEIMPKAWRAEGPALMRDQTGLTELSDHVIIAVYGNQVKLNSNGSQIGRFILNSAECVDAAGVITKRGSLTVQWQSRQVDARIPLILLSASVFVFAAMLVIQVLNLRKRQDD